MEAPGATLDPFQTVSRRGLLGNPSSIRARKGGPEDNKPPALLAFVGLVIEPGLVAAWPLYLPNADAAWLTSWSLDVTFVGLTSIEEPTSSNSKSSASDPNWVMPIWFWALPVLATP
jgi:hypothetical protein